VFTQAETEEKIFGTYFHGFLGLRELFKEDIIFYGAYEKFDLFY